MEIYTATLNIKNTKCYDCVLFRPTGQNFTTEKSQLGVCFWITISNRPMTTSKPPHFFHFLLLLPLQHRCTFTSSVAGTVRVSTVVSKLGSHPLFQFTYSCTFQRHTRAPNTVLLWLLIPLVSWGRKALCHRLLVTQSTDHRSDRKGPRALVAYCCCTQKGPWAAPHGVCEV